MKVYKLKTNGMKKEFVYAFLLDAVIMLTVLAVAFAITKEQIKRMTSTGLGLGLLLVFFGLALYGKLNFTYNRLKGMWNSFRIIVDGEVLTRQMQESFETYINLQDIDEIIEDDHRGMQIRDILKRRIFIPNSLEDYEGLKALIANGIKNAGVIKKKIYFNEWFYHTNNW